MPSGSRRYVRPQGHGSLVTRAMSPEKSLIIGCDLLAGGARDVEGIGGRAVERRRTQAAHQLDPALGLAADPRAERDHGRAERLGAGERAPAAEVEREERADEDRVAGPDPERPHDP